MTTFSETFSMAYSREPYAIALIQIVTDLHSIPGVGARGAEQMRLEQQLRRDSDRVKSELIGGLRGRP